MTTPKMILIFIEILLLVIFLIPAFLSIINAGNIAGILFSAAALIGTFYSEKLFGFIRSLWNHAPGRIFVIFVSLFLAFGIYFAGFITIRMIGAANNAPEEPATVVVLGCHVKGTKPSLMLARRLDAAYEYMTENPDVKCIVTGGMGTGEDITEAEAMKTYLCEKGIESDRILKEDKSTNTAENIAFAKAVMEKNGISGDIVIVTDNFHQYRASLIAEKQGLESYSISCSTKPELIPTYWVREWFALAKEIFLS
ncbi:MAG: YdcF family protein [Ruminococcus sp.]